MIMWWSESSTYRFRADSTRIYWISFCISNAISHAILLCLTTLHEVHAKNLSFINDLLIREGIFSDIVFIIAPLIYSTLLWYSFLTWSAVLLAPNPLPLGSSTAILSSSFSSNPATWV